MKKIDTSQCHMRSEQEMMALILNVAKQDDRIRAVVMNGSRTNLKAAKDIFQDYDIVYLVAEMESFIEDKRWIDVFGERIIMQTPEDMTMFPPSSSNRFAYLMQFMDGNRIDLTLLPLDAKESYIKEDKLTVVLLDKDHYLPELPSPSDEDYWVKPPSAEFFADCCNEFWWVSTYVAKGLWRKEILYAKHHLEGPVRAMLLKMLEWEIGIRTNFSVSAGKCGKYMEKYISKEGWQELISTYADGSYEDTWKALFAACNLFRSTAKVVAAHFHYEYPEKDDSSVTAYLKNVKEMARR
jgi:aminoglycoside 6-adenylyltransferase